MGANKEESIVSPPGAAAERTFVGIYLTIFERFRGFAHISGLPPLPLHLDQIRIPWPKTNHVLMHGESMFPPPKL